MPQPKSVDQVNWVKLQPYESELAHSLPKRNLLRLDSGTSMHDRFTILSINLIIDSWTVTVLRLSVRYMWVSPVYAVNLRLCWRANLTLPSSFNCMPNFLQSYPQHYAICLTPDPKYWWVSQSVAGTIYAAWRPNTHSVFFLQLHDPTHLCPPPHRHHYIVIFIHAWNSGSDSDEGSESIGYGSSDEPEDSVDSDGDEMFPPRRPPVKTLKEKASKHSSKKRRVK